MKIQLAKLAQSFLSTDQTQQALAMEMAKGLKVNIFQTCIDYLYAIENNPVDWVQYEHLTEVYFLLKSEKSIHKVLQQEVVKTGKEIQNSITNYLNSQGGLELELMDKEYDRLSCLSFSTEHSLELQFVPQNKSRESDWCLSINSFQNVHADLEDFQPYVRHAAQSYLDLEPMAVALGMIAGDIVTKGFVWEKLMQWARFRVEMYNNKVKMVNRLYYRLEAFLKAWRAKWEEASQEVLDQLEAGMVFDRLEDNFLIYEAGEDVTFTKGYESIRIVTYKKNKTRMKVEGLKDGIWHLNCNVETKTVPVKTMKYELLKHYQLRK